MELVTVISVTHIHYKLYAKVYIHKIGYTVIINVKLVII